MKGLLYMGLAEVNEVSDRPDPTLCPWRLYGTRYVLPPTSEEDNRTAEWNPSLRSQKEKRAPLCFTREGAERPWKQCSEFKIFGRKRSYTGEGWTNGPSTVTISIDLLGSAMRNVTVDLWKPELRTALSYWYKNEFYSIHASSAEVEEE